MSADDRKHLQKHRSTLTGRTRLTLNTAGRFLRARAWTWPLVLAVILAIAGFFLRSAVEQTLQDKMQSELQTLLDADVTALLIWFDGQTDIAEAAAETPGLQHAVADLVGFVDGGRDSQEIISSAEAEEVRSLLEPIVRQHDFQAYGIITPDGTIALTTQDFLVGTSVADDDLPLIADVMQRNAPLITPPRRSSLPIRDASGQFQTGVPTMYVIAPIRDASGTAIAVLVFRIPPGDEFSQILRVARMGESGETFAFNRDGLLLSQSRFDDELKRIGLLVDNADSHSILSLQIRDPGVNMVKGERPDVLRADQPLTHMVQSAIGNGPGVDVDGYNDYRGVPVVGAWTWLNEYDFGVATEVDESEAYAAFFLVERFAAANLALLVMASIGMLFASRVIARQQTRLRQHAIDARHLGQYTLDEKLGEGGMGEVYRGRHAMLRRPTAIKLMHAARTSDESIARFEREVQLTSQLTHPNTISIYDFGRTPEGVFYYAMEYIAGISLDDLVAEDGPQPEGRVIHILKQVCGSLAEAHEMGVVHRDIKPANIMLAWRGGIGDVVKVLDFGLVKAIDAEKQNALTAANSLTGTPHYMSPEAIHDPDRVDARSDLYALGAVGYFLLTGTPVFDGKSAVAVCTQHLQTAPDPPSRRIGKSIAEDLETILLSCLEKDPDSRPASARELATALDACEDAHTWTDADAEEWWQKRGQAGQRREFEFGATTAAATLIVGRGAADETR